MLKITTLTDQFKAGKTTPTQIARELLKAIKASPFNSFISFEEEAVMTQALAADKAYETGHPVSALHGVPVGIKDLIDVAGLRTTMGSEQFATNVALNDAVVVTSLRKAGAVILGKTNTHEFAYGSTGDRSFAGPVLNPRNPEHVSGGSSSGSAAATAAGLCAGALGTDTSASIRLPAALCGVVGMKPTIDLLPRAGVFALSQSLDHVGPISASVFDNALLLDALTDARYSYANSIGKSIAGRTVGVLTGFYADYLDAPIREALRRACDALEAAGARVVPIEVAGTQAIYDAQQRILKFEALAHHRAAISTGAPFQTEVLERLVAGSSVTPVDYAKAIYERPLAKQAFDHALSEVDVLLCPTCGIVAPKQNQRSTTIDHEDYPTFWLLTRLTAPTNFSGHPCVSVPFGSDTQGLSIGMQITGRFLDEAAVYQYASVLEVADKAI